MTGHDNAFPSIPESAQFSATCAALHAYARVVGDLTAHFKPRRKHWWHGSLRPALTGLSSGVLRAAVDFELVLDTRNSRLLVKTGDGHEQSLALQGQPAIELAAGLSRVLEERGIAGSSLPAPRDDAAQQKHHDSYNPVDAQCVSSVWRVVFSELEKFRHSLREETSPLQLWPHHFDIAMLWLPAR